MANSELVLAPVIDRNALKRSEVQLANAMESAGKKGSIAMQKDVKKHLKKGVEDGVEDGVSGSTGKFKALGVAVALGAAAIIADTIDKTLGSLEDNIDRIMGKLDTLREVNENAQAFGIDPARYAAISVMGAAKGMDQSDIQGIMAGFAASLQDEEMAAFKGIRDQQGMEKAFFDFLSSTAKLSGSARENQLIKVFGEDDMRLVSRLLNPMAAMQSAGESMNLESLYQNITGRTLQLEAMRAGIGRSQQAQGMITAQQAQFLENVFIKGVTPGQAGAVTSVAASQKNLEAAQMSALNLQVKAKILADQMEVKQIQAGIIGGEFMWDFFKEERDFAKTGDFWTYLKESAKNAPIQKVKDYNMPDWMANMTPGANSVVENAVSKAFGAAFDMIGQKLDELNDSLKDRASKAEASDHRSY